jgi:hypothetical protein
MIDHYKKRTAEQEQDSAAIFAFFWFILFYSQKNARGHEFLERLYVIYTESLHKGVPGFQAMTRGRGGGGRSRGA